MIKKAQIISLKDFRLDTAKYISRVKKGETFTVLKKNEPVFNITLPQLYDLSYIPEATEEDMLDLKKSKSILSFKKEGGIEAGELLRIMNNIKLHGR